MKKHFVDKVKGMGRHAIDTAFIIDENGEYAGKIFVRYTDSPIGWDHEIGVLFDGLTFGTTKKGDTYSRDTLPWLMLSIGYECLDWDKLKLVMDYYMHEESERASLRDVNSISSCQDIVYFRKGDDEYKVIWL